jgi:hypothetical protein
VVGAPRLPRKSRGMGLGMAATWDKGVARMWRRRLHGLHVDGGGGRSTVPTGGGGW